jgi:hypothetical protein
MTPVENLRGNSLPGRLNQSQSRAASNVALSYLFNSMKRNTDIKCEKKIKSSKKRNESRISPSEESDFSI